MRTVVLLLLLAACSNTYAQALWRDVPAGASVEQVRKQLPGVSTPREISRLSNGMEGLLELTGFQIVDQDFKATFYFKNAKLDRIFLRPIKDQTGGAARSSARRLRDNLTAKYGAPMSTSNRGASSLAAVWITQGIQVKFGFDQYSEDGTGFLILNYVAPQDSENI